MTNGVRRTENSFGRMIEGNSINLFRWPLPCGFKLHGSSFKRDDLDNNERPVYFFLKPNGLFAPSFFL
ncbi:MAG: hypothetical protein J0665_16465 [Deltaproteobacteria bacterium]|nr:hypothetical protein [Deltaproteobacteria bacterium]